MSYQVKTVSFPSSDGAHTVYGDIYCPTDREARGIVTLAHGMRDHVSRYRELAEYLTGEGFIFAGNEHLGHGRTAGCPEDFGYMGERDGYVNMIEDLHKMNSLVREEFPGLPVVLLGHSMGSFMARLYAQRYPETLDGIIIHGTGGRNPLLPFGKAIIKLIRLTRGSRHRSKLVTDIAFGSYNKRFDPSEGDEAWLTRDPSAITDRPTDPYCAFTFTAAGYADLFNMIGLSNSDSHFAAFPKELPTLVISGEEDPVGDYGKGVRFVHEKLSIAGVSSLTLKLYEGARHELFNETNRGEVFGYLVGWLSGALGV